MMAVRVHNTLTGRKEEFVPADPREVRVYVCGVTPYSDTHIGHARPSVFWDVVRRYLEYRGRRVRLVQNFTDVDDKVIAKALAAGEDPLAVSDRYSRDYLEVMDRLGVRRADLYPKVSEHMDQIIRVIQGLVDRGFAYERDGNVWFEVARFPGYGKLSKRTVDELRAGARVEVDETKRSPADFALWKKARAGEPSWPSPWGPGRPGWHIECTAMALAYLGSGFDLHGGGSELVFPHHENEIAQAEAFTGQEPFCRYWLHHEMVNIRGEKMSKSLGNFVTAREVLERAPAGAVRLMLLGAHYRKALDFDLDILDENQKAWRRLVEAVLRLRQAAGASAEGATGGDGSDPPDTSGAPRSELAAAAAEARRRFGAAMDDDFNTAAALAAIFDLVRQSNAALAHSDRKEAPVPGAAAALAALEELAGDVMGLFEDAERIDPAAGGSADVGPLLDIIIELRHRLRAERNFALADYIRDALTAAGFELKDTRDGTVVRKKE